MPQEIAVTNPTSGTDLRTRLRSLVQTGNSSTLSNQNNPTAIGSIKDAIASYWKNEGNDESKSLYNNFLNAKAQLEHLETLKAQSNTGSGSKLSAEQEQNLTKIKQRFENEAQTAKQSLLQNLGDNDEAQSLLFSEIKQGGPGTYKTLAKEFGATSDDLETPEWRGSHDDLAGKSSNLLGQRLIELGGENSPAKTQQAQAQIAASTTLPTIAGSFNRTPTGPDPSLMRAAYQAELQQQFQGARQAMGQQLQSQADAQRLAFSQEMMPQLTGEGVMMGHFGSTRQGISEGIARGRMESQLASDQAAAVANMESGFAGMQNQWGLTEMSANNQSALQDKAANNQFVLQDKEANNQFALQDKAANNQFALQIALQDKAANNQVALQDKAANNQFALQDKVANNQFALQIALQDKAANNQFALQDMAANNQFALQDMAGRQSIAEIGIRGQTDMEVARQRGLVDMDLARLQGDVSVDVSRQQNLMSQDAAARQSQMQQTMAQQQAMQAFELEKWRRGEDLNEKQLLMDREQAGQLRLKSVDSEQAMALEQLRNSQSQNQTLLQGQLDLKKAQMAGAFNIFGDMAKVGVMDGMPTPQNQMAAAVRKELGLPEFRPAPITKNALYGLNSPSNSVFQRTQSTLADAKTVQSRLVTVR